MAAGSTGSLGGMACSPPKIRGDPPTKVRFKKRLRQRDGSAGGECVDVVSAGSGQGAPADAGGQSIGRRIADDDYSCAAISTGLGLGAVRAAPAAAARVRGPSHTRSGVAARAAAAGSAGAIDVGERYTAKDGPVPLVIAAAAAAAAVVSGSSGDGGAKAYSAVAGLAGAGVLGRLTHPTRAATSAAQVKRIAIVCDAAGKNIGTCPCGRGGRFTPISAAPRTTRGRGNASLRSSSAAAVRGDRGERGVPAFASRGAGCRSASTGCADSNAISVCVQVQRGCLHIAAAAAAATVVAAAAAAAHRQDRESIGRRCGCGSWRVR